MWPECNAPAWTQRHRAGEAVGLAADVIALDRVMVLKRGENVGDRYIKKTTEPEVLEIIVSGRARTGPPPTRR